MDSEALVQAVIGLDGGVQKREKCDRPAVQVPADRLLRLMTRLRDEPALAFDMLMDHAAIDWIEQGRFELTYDLYSTVHGHHLMVAVQVPRDNPVAPSVSGVWAGAQWQEREVFDLMGILYSDHPDLRRVFLDDDWQGYPLRKDYKDDSMLELPK